MKDTQRLVERIDQYERLMRLDKPVGTLVMVWPMLWALWISAAGQPDPMVVWIFILGAVMMRSAACILNDLMDRDFDARVARTRDRPLVSGKVSTKEALALCAALLALSFSLVLCFRNLTMICLAFVALLLTATYPLTKRFLSVPQLYLGVALGFGVPMAYAAQTDALPKTCWYLLVASVFWTLAYDTEYAMVDREDDLKIGVKTSAITFGRFDVPFVMACYAAMLGLLAWLGQGLYRGWPYYVGIGAAAVLALYLFTLIRDRDPQKCFKAFRYNHWVGACVFAGIALDYLRQLHF